MTTDLIRRLLAVADDLDQRGYPYAGIIRQAAQLTTAPAAKSAANSSPSAPPLAGRRSTARAPLDGANKATPRAACLFTMGL